MKELAKGQNKVTMIRVGVLFGGKSSEREVSLSSGRQVYSSLDRSRFQGVALFMGPDSRIWALPEKLVIQNTTEDIINRLEREAELLPYETLPERVDVVFIALHGKYGDDGCIQGVLELLGIPYTGSGVLPCALSMDKSAAHRVLAAAGLEVAREIVVAEHEWQQDRAGVTEQIVQQLGLPCVVLPTREGSSVGVSIVQNAADLSAAMELAYTYDNAALVEEYLKGREFSVIIIGNEDAEALVPTEIITHNPYMTYDDKYMPGRSQKITPAQVPAEVLERIREHAVRAHKALRFRGYSRIDGFLLEDGRILITDPNSTSGMAPSSFMFHQAAEMGWTPPMIVGRILDLAMQAHEGKRGPLG
jgi:D-alanine-D-alanine ligase